MTPVYAHVMLLFPTSGLRVIILSAFPQLFQHPCNPLFNSLLIFLPRHQHENQYVATKILNNADVSKQGFKDKLVILKCIKNTRVEQFHHF